MSFNFSQTSGNSGITTISLSATSTTDVEAKVENYTLSNDSGSSVLMQVIQKAYEPVEKYINLKPSSIEWDGSGGTSSLQIQSNDNWVITSNSWIELSRFEEADRGLIHNTISGNGNTIIGIRAKENTGTTRTGGITGHCVSNSAISATTTVVQSAYTKPYIQLSYYSINCDSTGTTSSFTITSNVDWYIVVGERWTSVNTESGSGDANITFTVDENTSSIARSCDIAVYARDYGIKVSLVISQDATQLKPYITLSPDSFNVSPTGSTGNVISVSANCDYDIETDVNWITVSSSSGSGDGSVSFTTAPSDRIISNVGNIVFSNSALSRTVTVERQGEEPYLSASTNTVSFDLQSATALVSVYSNVSWDVIVDIEDENRPWLTVSPSSGSGNGTISVNASSATTERTCDIAVYNKEYGLSFKINILQIDPSALYYTTTDNQPIVFGNFPFAPANIVSHTFVNGQGKVTFDIPLTAIQASAFNGQTTLNSIYIPNTVSYYDIGAFAGTSLEYFETGDLVDKVNQGLLSTCASLKTVVIGSSVESLHGWCLAHCSSLETIYCYATTAPILNDRCFEDTTQTTGTVHYPAGSDYSSWQNNQYNYLDGWTFIGDL